MKNVELRVTLAYSITVKEIEQYTDADIIHHILAGDTALYEIIIRRYNPFLYKVGRSYNYSHEDTQDLMQDTFVAAYLNLSKFEQRASFKTWIIRIMLNHCFRKQQQASFRREQAEDIGERAVPLFSTARRADTNTIVMSRELNRVIEQSLGRLPLDYRLVFSLREINGLTTKETAEALDLSETNVKVRLNRAKAMLRKEIEKSYAAQEIFEFNLVYCDAIVEGVMGRLRKEDGGQANIKKHKSG